MNISLLSRWCGLLAVGLALSAAQAGEFFETDGVAIGGYDAVAYMNEQQAAKGNAQFAAVFKGSTFHFKNAANRDAFQLNPDKYAPRYGGYCAFGVSRGYKAVTSPDAFSIVDGRLYLNYNGEVKAMWGKDMPGYIGKADAQWSSVEKTTKVLR